MALLGLFSWDYLCLVPMTPCETMLYWLSPNHLVPTRSTRCTVDPVSRDTVKVAMGCRMEPAAVHIAHVLQRLHFFQFFLNIFHNLA